MSATGTRELKKEDEKFSDLLTCSICCSIFNHPLMLNCQHTFCLSCLAKSCKDNYQDEIGCAVCRQKTQFPRGVLSRLPRNHVVVDLLEKCGFKDCILNQKQVHKILTDAKQRRHPTRLPTDIDDNESGSSSEETESSDSDSTLNESSQSDLISEDSESEDSSDDSSDASSDNGTTTGTISEEYTLDSETDSTN